MPAILGIDAAWTPTQPSGIALVADDSSRWHLIAAEPSYQHFIALSSRSLLSQKRPTGSPPQIAALLAAAAVLCGQVVDLVAVDMPLARSAIVGRRYSDDEVSRAYGGRKCGTYTPSVLRPGPLSDALTEDFARAGYPLRTETIATPGLIEVYPHPALVELTGAAERLPYKASKVGTYWPSATRSERRTRLYQQWREIIASLEGEIGGVATALPKLESNAGVADMKAYEDMLDAITCAWVGVCALDGRAIPYGNDDAAIWIPRPRVDVSTVILDRRRLRPVL